MAVDTKRILSVAKKNWVSIASGVVAVVAIAVPFVVADGWMTETQNALAQRQGVARSVEDIGRKSRSLPQTDPDATERRPLEMFPSRSVIAAGQAAKAHLEAQGNKLLEEALKLNVRRPLLEDVFRATPQQYRGAAFRFRDEYQKFMPDGLSQLVRGGVPYSAEQVQRFVAAERERIQRERAVRAGGQIINADEVQRLLQEAERRLPETLRNEVALSNQVYLSLDTWMVDPNMATMAQPPTPEAVWFAQVGLWIQQEAARIVLAANEGSANVFSSPVKHLLAVRFVPYGQQGSTFGPYIMPAGGSSSAGGGGGFDDQGGGMGFGGGGGGGGAAMSAAPLTGNDPAAPINLARGAFLTGRQASGMFDVVHFNMVVRVAESRVAEFLASIPRGRLVNVLNVQMSSINAATESAAGYIYGNEPVVQLEVECEMLMLRRWTQTLMPPRVRVLLGVEAPVAAAP